MPNWNYSTSTGSMVVDGIQWFVFENKEAIDSNIEIKKYAKGDFGIHYFRNNGIEFSGDSFDVTEAGVYTVYCKTTNGVERIRTITIDNIDEKAPDINVVLNGYIAGTPTSDDVPAIVIGTDLDAGVKDIEYSLDGTSWISILPENNNNLILNSDFEKTEPTMAGWNRTLNGDKDVKYWTLYNNEVTNAGAGYHPHVDSTKFKSNVLAFVNKNSEVGSIGRSLKASTDIETTLEPATTYVLTLDMYAENAGVSLTGGMYYKVGSSTDFASGKMNFTANDSEVGHWITKTYSFVTETNTDVTTQGQLILLGNEGEEGTFYVRNVKLEKGTDPTSWTPHESEQIANGSMKGYVKFTETPADSTVYFRVTDFANNTSITQREIIIDKEKPKIINFTINDGDALTKEVSVIVELGATKADYMYISNSSGEPGADDWVPYSKYSRFTLTKNNKDKTVYAWCKDSIGNVSEVATSIIELNVTYTLRVRCNQTSSSTVPITAYYTIVDAVDTEAEYAPWQESNEFKGLIPNKVYKIKTKIEDEKGLSKESKELTFRYVFDSGGKLEFNEL